MLHYSLHSLQVLNQLLMNKCVCACVFRCVGEVNFDIILDFKTCIHKQQCAVKTGVIVSENGPPCTNIDNNINDLLILSKYASLNQNKICFLFGTRTFPSD